MHTDMPSVALPLHTPVNEAAPNKQEVSTHICAHMNQSVNLQPCVHAPAYHIPICPDSPYGPFS